MQPWRGNALVKLLFHACILSILAAECRRLVNHVWCFLDGMLGGGLILLFHLFGLLYRSCIGNAAPLDVDPQKVLLQLICACR